MSRTTDFRVTYDGPALASSQMHVRELAPALLAAGDLLNAATLRLCGEQVRAQVNVKASFKSGSFGIDFSLATDLATRVQEFFVSDRATAAANASAILGLLGISASGGCLGVLQAIKWIRGRRIQQIDLQHKSAVLRIDGEQLDIELAVLALLRDAAVRESIAATLAPLQREGISTFAIGMGEDFAEIIAKEQTQWFIPPEIPDELLVDETRKMILSLISVSFKENAKWVLHDGNATIVAAITDKPFLHQINTGQIRFARGDLLVCEVRVHQWHVQGGARIDYEILRVLEHRMATRQVPLPEHWQDEESATISPPTEH